MQHLDIIGTIAGAVTTLSYVPQIWKIWKTKSANDVSYGMYAILYLGIGLWTYYGIMLGATPMIVANAFCITFMTIIMVLKVKYRDNRINDSEHVNKCETCINNRNTQS